MTPNQSGGPSLAARCVTTSNDPDGDAGDGFVDVDYIDHDHFVTDGREANWAFWTSLFTAFPGTGRFVAAVVRDAGLNVYPGAGHGLPPTHPDTFNDDLLVVVEH
jgi:hypothetical protein